MAVSAWPFRRGRFGAAVSARPFRRGRFGAAVSAPADSAQRRFGAETIRRRDDSALADSAPGHFGADLSKNKFLTIFFSKKQIFDFRGRGKFFSMKKKKIFEGKFDLEPWMTVRAIRKT